MRTLSSVILLVVIIMLSACNGANPDNDKNNLGKGNVTSEQVDEATTEPEDMADEPIVNEPARPDTNGKLAATLDIELSIEGQVETRLGTLAVSDNGYYMYTLPQFKFTPEEPNVDQVYMDKFEDHYMRIIALGTEPELAHIRSSAKEELAMLGNVTEMKGDQISEPALRDSTLYLHASDSELSKYIIVRQIDDHYMKIILNIPIGEALDGAGPSFSAMIKTIELLRS
jgi:hypothetical protein